MSAIRLAVGCLLALLLTEAAGFAQSSAKVGNGLPEERALNRLGLTRRWWSHATIDSRRDKIKYLTADEKYLFMQASSGVVSTFDAQTGKHLWSRTIGHKDQAVFQATLNERNLFIVSGLSLFAVSKDTGSVEWELNLPGQPSTSPAADSARAYVGFLDGSMYAFDLETVYELNKKGMLPEHSVGAVEWRYRTSEPIAIPAVPSGTFVAFASRNGSLYSVTAKDRKLVFQFETDAALSAPIVSYKNTLLVASEDTNFYSLNMINGRRAWEYTAGLIIQKAPVLIDDEIYLLPERGDLIQLSAANGNERWKAPHVQGFLAASSQRVYVFDNQYQLAILDRVTGRRLGGVPLARFNKAVTNDRSDRIYLATESGLLMCLHELGRDFPRFHLHPELQPVLPEFAPEAPAEQPAGETPEPPQPEDAPEAEAPSEGEAQ